LSARAGTPLRHQNRALTSVRGVMALWVVGHHLQFELGLLGYHYFGWLFRPGYVGVDIFFVLSGFVITAVHRDMVPKDARDFFIRRIFRIYPLHLVVLAVLLGFWLRDLWLGAPFSMPRLAHLGIVALLLQPYLIHDQDWNVVSWSIGVELLCYALFPLAIRLLRRMNLVVSLGVLIIALFYERHVHSELIWGWPAIARGLGGFALGMMVQQMTVLCPRPGARVATRIELVAVAFMLIAVLLRDLALIPLLGALLIYGLAAERGAVSRLMSGPTWFWLGQISFSVYLLHPTVITLAFAWLPPARLGHDLGLTLGANLTALVWTALVLALLLGLATLTWRLVEEPMRRYGARLARQISAAAPRRRAEVTRSR
jgi:peptidoglycan/LPS O-acetylase OafA/YrhL